MIIPVLLAGGFGTRLWPLSRELYPKQLLSLVGKETMLQQTLRRVERLSEVGRPIVVCIEAHRFMVAEQLRAIGVKADIIIEPVGRDTAPAVAAAALQARAKGEDPLLLVLPSDHLVEQVDVFAMAVAAGASRAEDGYLVTFGIVPDRPETGYGYIQRGRPLAKSVATSPVAPEVNDPHPHSHRNSNNNDSSNRDHGSVGDHNDTPISALKAEVGQVASSLTSGLNSLNDHAESWLAYAVTRFVEKPDAATAQSYVEQGYLWNSGMFIFRASNLLTQLAEFEPEVVRQVTRSHGLMVRDLDFIRLEEKTFTAAPALSLDYAVMERTSEAAVLPLACGWSDIGSWNTLWNIGDKDGDGNVFQGQVMARDSRSCYVQAESRLLALLGVDNLVVVETTDAVLVASRDRVQEVKELVRELKRQGRNEAVLHRRVFRPWGSYECVDIAERFQVKRLVVNPGASLSLQCHYHRAEHWVVVKGTAEVVTGDNTVLLSENQSSFIPVGVRHRLRNPGLIPLEIIEVQSGSYLGEDDIERFDDIYGR